MDNECDGWTVIDTRQIHHPLSSTGRTQKYLPRYTQKYLDLYLVLSYSCPRDISARRYELGSAPGPGVSPGNESMIRTNEEGNIPDLPPQTPLQGCNHILVLAGSIDTIIMI